MKIKICGITNYEDASAAVALGADALGFIFAKSPRQVDPETVRDIVCSLPPPLVSVGVFVNETVNKINDITAFCGLDMIQLHGDEIPDMCKTLMPRTIKAFQLKDESSIEQIRPYQGKVRAFLFDTYSKEMRGGTGKAFDWGLAVHLARQRPVILAGGLNPDNITRAVETVKPYAVDVSSGVEREPGRKDHAKIAGFIARAKTVGLLTR